MSDLNTSGVEIFSCSKCNAIAELHYDITRDADYVTGTLCHCGLKHSMTCFKLIPTASYLKHRLACEYKIKCY